MLLGVILIALVLLAGGMWIARRQLFARFVASPTPGALALVSPAPSPSPSPSPTRTPSPSPTRTATPTATRTLRPTATPTPTVTPTASATPTPSPSPDPCAERSNYRLSLVSPQPLLDPPPGSPLSADMELAQASWEVQNSGRCPLAAVRFIFEPSGQQAGPAGLPRLELGSQSAWLSAFMPGQRSTVRLAVPITDVLMRAVDWRWLIQLQMEDGSWIDAPEALVLRTESAWVLPPIPTPVRRTPTPVPTLAPPVLLRPQPPANYQTFDGEETYAGPDDAPVFSWSQPGRPLLDDEYFVVAIAHRSGVEYRWAGKETSYRAAGQGLGWLIDFADNAGRLRWRVLVVRSGVPRQVGAPEPGEAIVAQSGEGTFRWVYREAEEKKRRGGGID